MKKFLKKMTEKAALTAFNIFKDRKIQEARHQLADGFNTTIEKSALSLRAFLLAIFIAGGGSAGIVLLTLAGVACQVRAVVDDDSKFHSALQGSTCLLTTVGVLSLLLPLIVFLPATSVTIWRWAFAADLEKKIRGK